MVESLLTETPGLEPLLCEKQKIEPGVVVQACYLSTQEAEEGMLHIQAQPGIARASSWQ